jgi:hypothetical protein
VIRWGNDDCSNVVIVVVMLLPSCSKNLRGTGIRDPHRKVTSDRQINTYVESTVWIYVIRKRKKGQRVFVQPEERLDCSVPLFHQPNLTNPPNYVVTPKKLVEISKIGFELFPGEKNEVFVLQVDVYRGRVRT